jgi:hypothetical protein
MARQRVAVEAGDGLEFLGCHHAHEVFVEEDARAFDRDGGCHEGRRCLQRRVEREEGIGDLGYDLVAPQRLERAPEIGKSGVKSA